MDIKIERKIEVNRWVIKARWFYVFGIFLIVFLNKVASKTDVDVYNFGIFAFVIFLANFLFYLVLRRTKNSISDGKLTLIGYFQVMAELLIISAAVYLTGGQNSLFLIFYLLPIISSSFLIGVRGSVFVALTSVVSYVAVVFLEDKNILPDIKYYEVSFFVKSAMVLFLFVTIGTFSGFLMKLLVRREELLREKTDALIKESEYRENEWRQLDKTTKLLVKRDHELTFSNDELEIKMKDLKRSEKSMLKAFSDLKAERKKTEEERNKTMAIISNFIDPIIVLDRENKIELFNPAAVEIFGFSNEDLGKMVLSENNFSMENFKDIVNQEFDIKRSEDLESGNFIEEISVKINEQESTYKVITAPVFDSDREKIGNMKIFYNMTREKMLDKLKSEFISIAAHQLRTPLAAIKWVIQMVLTGDVGAINEEQKEILTKGYKSNERIIELVNDMLNVSRIEEGRFGYSFEKGDILKELEVVIDSLDPKIKEKNIKLITNKPEKVPEVYMDPTKIILVLQNLIENAVKYTPDFGKIEVIIEVGEKMLKVHIKDSGVGIPKEDQAKLFSKFFRAKNVIRMQTEGSGLGLFMVRNIIQKHGGDIVFVSEEGVGTEFIFTLPIEKNS